MKLQLVSKMRAGVSAAVVAVAFLASASAVQAQDLRVKAAVPFAFEDGNQHFRAGDYVIGMHSANILTIDGRKDRGLLMVSNYENHQPTAKGKLVFTQYGNRYFLREVWLPNTSSHIVCPKSRAERHVTLAQNDTGDHQVELALLTAPR